MDEFPNEHLNHFRKFSSGLLESKFDPIRYLQACGKDFENELRYLVNLSRPVGWHDYNIDYEIVSNLEFGASICWKSSNSGLTSINLGTWIALQDLFYRMCSNESFLSFDFSDDGKKLWNGGHVCMHSSPHGTQPLSRFSDYRTPVPSEEDFYHFGQFVDVIPIGDPGRMQLAHMLRRAALLWIILHEEGHFLDGHLSYLKEKFSLDASQSNFDESQLSHAMLESGHSLRRLFEYSADRTATRGVFDIFFMDDQLELLPKYCKGNPELWLFRLLVVAIGGVIQIVQKRQNMLDTSGYYPDARIRFSGVVRYMSNKLMSRPEHCCRNPRVRNAVAELPKIFLCAADDLCAIAALITRDGRVQVDSNNSAFVRERTKPQNLFETEDAVTDFIEILPLIYLAPNERSRFTEMAFGEDRSSEIEARYNYWFADFEHAEIAYRTFSQDHLKEYWSKFSIR